MGSSLLASTRPYELLCSQYAPRWNRLGVGRTISSRAVKVIDRVIFPVISEGLPIHLMSGAIAMGLRMA